MLRRPALGKKAAWHPPSGRGASVRSPGPAERSSALAAIVMVATALPPSAQGAFCNGAFFILQQGHCSTTTSQTCFVDLRLSRW